ncbi:HAMP domain-containing protein [Granulicella sp. WH15]|uniref:ATP-binding protein n=1 Tax=Granulicella sp. WH15 TaxID=2602070 RepID=UPI00136784DE|nr:ATP-binding protein [Granulicella sp. WH15]QHN05216.1 HAMP domain-containing protein [Granulicella sp. WH15]
MTDSANPISLIYRLPLRVRLTLWYSLVFATALFALGFASLWMVHRAVESLENNELQQRVRSVRRFVESRPEHESLAATRAAMTSAYNASHGNKWLQVIDEHGQWLYRSSHVADIYPQLTLPQATPPESNYFTYTADAIHVRALIEPVTIRGVHYTVQTGLTLDKTLVILTNFRIQLFVLTSLGLIVSSLAGYFMSRKALSPIAAIAAEAQRINDKNLNSRMPELATRDELAALSTTLNQMLGRIEAGYQSVRSFTANAAHELRSPVALLRAETEVALAFPRDAEYYRQTCRHILSNSQQMSRLIDQLLALARADAGVEVIRLEPIHLPDLIEETAAEWSERFREAGIHFRHEAIDTELWIEGDYSALKRLLNSLLENAWRYVPSGQACTLALCEFEGQAAEISVSDTGPGISLKDQPRIFDRFYRVARPVHGDFPGSGLGLVLAQWIAEQHHSRIRLWSEPGQGSCFSLALATLATPEFTRAEQLGEQSHQVH